jgi:hypothetical protein
MSYGALPCFDEVGLLEPFCWDVLLVLDEMVRVWLCSLEWCSYWGTGNRSGLGWSLGIDVKRL